MTTVTVTVRPSCAISLQALHNSFLIGVGATLCAWAFHNADETTVVDESFLCAASQNFLLLRFGNFGCLILHFTSTCQTAVNLAHCCLLCHSQTRISAAILLEP